MVIRLSKSDIKLKYLDKRNRALSKRIERLKLEQAEVKIQIAKIVKDKAG